MRVWRLAAGRFRETDGEGASLYGGRWNSRGVPVVYAATHLALAVLEQLVHLRPERVPDSFRAFAIDLPEDEAGEDVAPGAVAVADAQATRRYGDQWAASLRSAALIVPSVIVPPALAPGDIATAERNVVLNPRHRSAASWRVVETSFRVDPRLQQAGRLQQAAPTPRPPG